MDNLSGFQRDLLYVIASLDTPSGSDVGLAMQEYYDTEVNHGRLYSNLDDLVDGGLVEKGELDRRTNSYTLTDAGHATLRERREWEDQLADL